MPTPRTPDSKLGDKPPVNHARGKAHWPLDLELHPDRDEDEEAPPNPAPEPVSVHRARQDEQPSPRPPESSVPSVNHARGKAHWPLDLELHPDRDEDKDVTHPLNPPPEQRSTRRAQEDERPGS